MVPPDSVYVAKLSDVCSRIHTELKGQKDPSELEPALKNGKTRHRALENDSVRAQARNIDPWRLVYWLT
jgi:hypothetical protein